MGKTFKTEDQDEARLGYKFEKVVVTSYSSGGSSSTPDADRFDFTAAEEKQEIGLLLPAVQAAYDVEDGTFGFGIETDEQQVALLLPAVQAAREAASDPLPTETFSLNYEKVEFSPVDNGFVWM